MEIPYPQLEEDLLVKEKIIEYLDFIPLYPNKNDPQLQAKIASKQEFRELKATAQEKLIPGQFYKHQVIIDRYMRQYSKLLLFHEAGTGKTCAITKVAEDFKLRQNLDGKVRRCIILTTSESLYNEFKNQIVMKCTGGIYQTDTVKEKNIKERRRKITNNLRDWYDFYTYITFHSEVKKEFAQDGKLTNASWEGIKAKYSNYMVACDEIHVLQNEREGKYAEAYQFLKTFFRIVPGIVEILSTATPMTNEFKDLAKIIDLLSEEDIGEIDINDPEIESRLFQYLNGKVSYVRAGDTGINLVNLGNPLNIIYSNGYHSQLILDTGLMSPFQSLGYLKSYIEDTKTGQNKVWLNSRQASGMVYPDGSYGKAGYKKYFGSSGDIFKSEKLLTAFREDAKTRTGYDPEIILSNIAKYSIKIYNTLNLITIPNRKSYRGPVYPGVKFIFFELIQSSLAPFCIALESLGFSRFMNSEPLDTIVKEDKIILSKEPRYGVITGKSDRHIVSNLIEILNHPDNANGEYVQIIVGSKATRIGYNFYNVTVIDIFEPWWNPSSIYQAINRGLRATGHEAILDLLRQVNPNARLDVRLSRSAAIPLNDTLVKEIAAALIGGEKTPAAESILESYNEVDIEEFNQYKKELTKHMTFLNRGIKISEEVQVGPGETEYIEEEGENISNKELQNVEIVETRIPPSRDVIMYQISEQKEIEIKKGTRILKRIAFDCELNLDRNIRSTDIPGSQECDYTDCTYEPIYKAEKIDFSSYNLLYSGKVVEKIKDDLLENTKSQTFHPNNLTENIALLSLEQELLSNQYRFPRFYKNISGYLYPTAPGIAFDTFNDYYLDNLIFIDKTSTTQLISDLTKESKKITKIRSSNPNKSKFREEIETLPLNDLIELIEQILLAGAETTAEQKILDVYKNYIFNLVEAIPLIEEERKLREYSESIKATRPGKSHTRGTKTPKVDWGEKYLEYLEVLEKNYDVHSAKELLSNPEVPKILIHTLGILNLKTSNYANVKHYENVDCDLRILDLTDLEAGWRNATVDESVVYKKIIGTRYSHLLNPDKRTADNILIPYGSVIPLNTKNGRQDIFKLRIELPGQNKSTYKICETYEIADLLNILVDLGYQVDKNNITKEEAREIARSSNYSSPPNIGEKLSKKYLTQVGYILYDIEQEQVADRKVLCGIIQKLLKERNAFFTLREW